MRAEERGQVMESRASGGSRCDAASASRKPQSHRWEMKPTPALCSQAQDPWLCSEPRPSPARGQAAAGGACRLPSPSAPALGGSAHE